MTTIVLTASLALLVGYLVGSIPFGLVVGKYYGVDPRTIGSGRTGGSNVYRAAGAKAGLLTAALDASKGALAVLLIRLLYPLFAEPATAGVGVGVTAALAAVAAVAGHNWSLFLRFKGGAGTMTNLGNLLSLCPPLFLLVGALGLGALQHWRMSSLASLIIAWTLAALCLLGTRLGLIPTPLSVYGVGQVVLITCALRPNIHRLLAGTERRL
jgi:glycerol-3-phosphate acyltransferase PlsY